MGRAVKQSTFQFLNSFFISQNVLLAMQKKITVEDNKKRMTIANCINIYSNICTYNICDEKNSKPK